MSDQGPSIRGLSLGLAAGLAGLLALIWNTLHVRQMLAVHMNDFGRFYYGTRAFLDGGSLYQPTVATPVDFGNGLTTELVNLGSPAFHLLLLPLASLPPTGALGAWTVLGVLSLAAAVRLVLVELELRPSAAQWGVVVVAFVCFAGTTAQVVTGQVAWLLAWPVTAAWVAARRKDQVRLGILVGLLTVVKPLFAVFGPWLLLTRQWRAAGLAAGVGLAGVGLAGFAFGPGAWLEWAGALGVVDWHWLPMNGSLTGLAGRSLSANPVYASLVDLGPASRWVGLGLGVLVLLETWRRSVHASPDRAVALLLLGALLASPLAWVYYHLLLVPPLLALQLRKGPPPRWAVAALSVCFAFPFAATWTVKEIGVAVVVVGAPYLWGTFGLWVAQVRAPTLRGAGDPVG